VLPSPATHSAVPSETYGTTAVLVTATFLQPATHAAQVEVSTGLQPSPAIHAVFPTEANGTTAVPVTATFPQPATHAAQVQVSTGVQPSPATLVASPTEANGTTVVPVTAVLPQPATQGVAQVQVSTGVPPSTTAQVVNPSQQGVHTKPTYQDIAAIALNNETKRIDADMKRIEANKEVGLKREEVNLEMVGMLKAAFLSLSVRKRGHAELSNGDSDSDDTDRKPSRRS
jgi:hypothetical protein